MKQYDNVPLDGKAMKIEMAAGAALVQGSIQQRIAPRPRTRWVTWRSNHCQCRGTISGGTFLSNTTGNASDLILVDKFVIFILIELGHTIPFQHGLDHNEKLSISCFFLFL